MQLYELCAGTLCVVYLVRPEPITGQMACMGLGCAEGGICCGGMIGVIHAEQAVITLCCEDSGRAPHSLERPMLTAALPQLAPKWRPSSHL